MYRIFHVVCHRCFLEMPERFLGFDRPAHKKKNVININSKDYKAT